MAQRSELFTSLMTGSSDGNDAHEKATPQPGDANSGIPPEPGMPWTRATDPFSDQDWG